MSKIPDLPPRCNAFAMMLQALIRYGIAVITGLQESKRRLRIFANETTQPVEKSFHSSRFSQVNTS